MCDLIRRDQERQQKTAELQGLIDKGLQSGVSARTMSDLLAEARRRASTTTSDLIRAALIEGEQSGPAEPFDFDRFLARKHSQQQAD